LKLSKPGIHAVFGTAMHRCIQEWIHTLLTDSVKKSEEIDFAEMLLTFLKEEYGKEVTKSGTHFSTKEELSEFYLDGLQILAWIRKNRKRYFDSKFDQLIGIEVPLLLPPDPIKPNVILMAYLDLITRDSRDGSFTIFDIKTSTRGWSDYDKRNDTKISQLLLYKIYFSQQYGIPIDDVKVKYLIVKRKIDENSEFPQRRVQEFIPAQKTPSLNKVKINFSQFLDECFIDTGKYNVDGSYQPIAGSKYQNCRFCEFNDEKYCSLKERITDNV
jgi:aryl carrier-like protein